MEELTITESAEKYLDELLGSQEKDTVGIKIFVSEPGTPRAETCIAYAKEDENLEDYLLIEELSFSLLLTSLGGIALLYYPNFILLCLIYGYWGVTSILFCWSALIKATRIVGKEKQGLSFVF